MTAADAVGQGHGLGALTRVLVGALESRAAVILGAFSYSLYLVHMPLLLVAKHLLEPTPLSNGALLAVEFLLVVPVIVAINYGFSLAFEKPFAGAPRRQVPPVDAAAATLMPAEAAKEAVTTGECRAELPGALLTPQDR